MSQIVAKLIYLDVGAEGIDRVRPLWEKLNAHHAVLSRRFGSAIRIRTFDARKQKLLAKADSGKLRVDLVSADSDEPSVAYCISTISTDGVGEIDSIFVEEHLRGQGVGTELMRRALAWLESIKATSKIVSVMTENEEALAFYRRFGFHPRTILLQESHDALCPTRLLLH
jgi:ribosomal protein S18 acetylase RimI-like enzyme